MYAQNIHSPGRIACEVFFSLSLSLRGRCVDLTPKIPRDFPSGREPKVMLLKSWQHVPGTQRPHPDSQGS